MYVDDLMAKHIAAADPHTQYAPKESPTLTGTPKVPTAPAGTNTTQIASTAFVQAVVTALNNALALKAPLASPALTGTPTAPTAAQTVNNTQIATTAFVKSAIAALVASSPAALDTLNELAAALGNDPNFATTMTNALAGKQPLDSTLTSLSGKSVADLIQYLGLGTVATKNVGNGAGQIPDMGFFGKIFSNGSVTGGFTFPNGMIIQTAAITSIPAGTSVEVTYPIPFPTTMCFATGVASGSGDSTVPISIGIDAQSVSDARKTLLLRNFSTRSNAGSRYIAIGY